MASQVGAAPQHNDAEHRASVQRKFPESLFLSLTEDYATCSNDISLH